MLTPALELPVLIAQLLREHKTHSWAALARKYGVHKAVLWRIANDGYEPKNAELRKRLGLPERIIVTVRRNEKGRFTGEEQEDE